MTMRYANLAPDHLARVIFINPLFKQQEVKWGTSIFRRGFLSLSIGNVRDRID